MVSKLKYLFDIIAFLVLGPNKYAKFVGVSLGDGCRIYIKNWGAEPFLISIGNRVTITSGVRFITHDGATWLVHNDNNVRYQRYGEIKVGNNVFIGVNTLIMPGVQIGDNVIVGAGSVVTKNLKNNGVYVGVPARKVCSFDDYSTKVKSSCATNSDLDDFQDYKARVYRAIELQHDKQ